MIAYSATYKQHGDEFSADISINRHTAGQLPVFGIDDVDISLAGRSAGVTASCRGKSRQASGMEFEVTLIRMAG